MVGGDAVRQVERLAEGDGYRVAFPPQVRDGPALFEVDYRIPAGRAGATCAPPRLVDGGVVQETLWEVRIPWGLALLGSPSGWSDENEWHWDLYMWKRRPRRTSSAMAAWVTGAGSEQATAADVSAASQSDYHSYLFGRPGDPADIALSI